MSNKYIPDPFPHVASGLDGVAQDAKNWLRERFTAAREFVPELDMVIWLGTVGLAIHAGSIIVDNHQKQEAEFRRGSTSSQYDSVNRGMARVSCKDELTGRQYTAVPESIADLETMKNTNCILKLIP